MRRIFWTTIFLLGTALLLFSSAAVMGFHNQALAAESVSAEGFSEAIIAEPVPAEADTKEDTEEVIGEDIEENTEEDIEEETLLDETDEGLFHFDCLGGAVIMFWDPEQLSAGDSVELTVFGSQSQRGFIAPASQAIIVFQDGNDGERYSFNVKIRHSDGSLEDKAEKNITFLLHAQTGSKLPLIRIDTVSKQNPSFQTMQTPEGALGESITQNSFEKAICSISDPESADWYCSEAKIRVRGNTSAASRGKEGKVPYKLVLDTPVDLFDSGREETRFVLLAAGGEDLKSYLGFSIAQILEMPWAENCRFVNLVLNGNWRGLYLITEAIDGVIRDEHVASDGLLLEYDAYWWKEEYYYRTAYSPDYMAYTVKYPEIEFGTEEDARFQDYVEAVENSILGKTEFEYLDIDSFVKWIMVRDLLGHGDPCGSNMYYYLRHWNPEDPAAEKLAMGPLWDFDAAFSCKDEWSNQRDYPSWFYWLFQDARFRERYVSEWKSFEPVLIPALSSVLGQLCGTYGDSVNLSRYLDALRWEQKGFTPVEEEARQRLEWLKNRVDWMNSAAEQMTDEVFGDANISVSVSEDCTSVKSLLLDEGYSEVRFAIWSKENGQDDLHWYPARKDSNGNWSCVADLHNHRSAGEYTICAYEGTGGSLLCASGFYVKQALVLEEYVVWSWIDSTHIQLRFIGNQPREQIEFAVWSEENGQDDLAWYQAGQDPDGVWSYTMDLDRHTEKGLLHVHVYETGEGICLFLYNASIDLTL